MMICLYACMYICKYSRCPNKQKSMSGHLKTKLHKIVSHYVEVTIWFLEHLQEQQILFKS